MKKVVDDSPSEGVTREISNTKRFGMIEVKFFHCIESGAAGIAPQASRQQSLEFISKPFKGSPLLVLAPWSPIFLSPLPAVEVAASPATNLLNQLTATLGEFQALKHPVDALLLPHFYRPVVAPPIISELSHARDDESTAGSPITNPPTAARPVGAEIRDPRDVPREGPLPGFSGTSRRGTSLATSHRGHIVKYIPGSESPSPRRRGFSRQHILSPLLLWPRSPHPFPPWGTEICKAVFGEGGAAKRLVYSARFSESVTRPQALGIAHADQKRAMRVVRVFVAEKKKKDKDEDEKKKDDAEKEKGKPEVKNHDETTGIAH
ncbi:hypothetical protein DL764_009923 [Monosporascus ibericus]|uniref:Uncharacterized protein n=1 Tax=Monosporascus ibericus TaxID=155417 RepID=A0A4Q4STR1_9PEZI|nr:hypothetical protein DL764_009923 [Monosporascus ibericus]